MPDPFVSAKTELKKRHQRANWSKLLLRPIQLHDGTALITLKDAAVRILELPPAPPSQAAAQRIIDSAMGEGDMIATEIAVRLALVKQPPAQTELDRLKTLYASITDRNPAKTDCLTRRHPQTANERL